MHPRSIYKDRPPDFAQLAQKYEKFKPFVKWNINGKAYIDFNDAQAQRALTTCLMQQDFGIKLELPEGRLCPPIPNRLNYILWIQDLLDGTLSDASQVRGLDIGTGASCIYPLLGCATRATWSFMATEIDEMSLHWARLNVENNHLQHRIDLIDQRAFQTLIPTLPTDFDFCMCNPPFYASKEQIQQSIAAKSLHPSGACTGADVEMITKGGEYGFISRLLRDSISTGTQIRWYSTMVGHLDTLHKVVGDLKGQKIDNYTITDFVQGNTRRWAIAWSFHPQRPRWALSAGTSGLIAHTLRPLQTDFNFALNSVDVSSIQKAVRETLSIEEIAFEATGDVQGRVFTDTWSRSARRKRQRGEPLSGDQSRQFDFAIVLADDKCQTSVTVRWLAGHDFTMFESFYNHLKRRLQDQYHPSTKNDILKDQVAR